MNRLRMTSVGAILALVLAAAPVLTAPLGASTAVAAELPGAPERVWWTQYEGREADGDIYLSWSAPLSDGGSPITAYDIQQTKDGEWIDLHTFRSVSGRLTLQISELPRGVTYRFRVAAVTAEGRGPWIESDDVRLRTKPSAPRDVKWRVSPAGDLVITWQPPLDTGGPPPPNSAWPALTLYTLHLSEDGSTWIPVMSVNADGLRQLLFSRYRVGERSYFRMTASNEIGAGPASASTPLFAPTEARPGPVTNLRIAFRQLPSGKVAATLTWTPGDSGGLPQKFRLRVKVNGQDRVKNKTVSGTRFTVSNIPKMDYRQRPTNVFASVVAQNTKYASPDTVTQEAYVPQ